MTACFQPTPCQESTGAIAHLQFKNANGRRIQSPYSRVYEKSMMTNIDSIKAGRDTLYTPNYHLPFPTVANPKILCFVFEKPNGQKDSITIKGDLYYSYESRSCGIYTKYKNLNIITDKTSFPIANIKLSEYSVYIQYALQITL